MNQSGQQTIKHAPRIEQTFDVVHQMILIGTAESLVALRGRNEQRLAIAKAQPAGRQVFRQEMNA